LPQEQQPAKCRCGAADFARLRSGLRQHGRKRPFVTGWAAARQTPPAYAPASGSKVENHRFWRDGLRQRGIGNEPDFRREKQIPRA